MSPAVTPRPLPPHPTGMRPGTLYTVNADTIEEEEEEPEYQHANPNVPSQYEYSQPLPPQQQHYDYQPGPSSRRFTVESAEPIPVLASTPSPPATTKKRSFVGGFMKGVKRFPGKVLGYGTSKEKSRLFRRGTLGTETSGGGGGAGRGNTLPEYRSNPGSPLGTPGAVQYVQDMRMAFSPNQFIPDVVRSPPSEGTAMPPERNIPPSLMAGGALRRPVTPSLHITPPSDDASRDSHHESYQSHPQESYQSHSYAIHQVPQPQYAQVVYPDPAVSPGNAERTTVMVYSESTVDPHGAPMSDPGPQRMPSRTPRASVVPPRQSTITIQTPIRQSNPPPPPPPMGAQAPLAQAPPSQDPQTVFERGDTIMSPATERMPPTTDYRKMSNYPGSPSRGTVWTRTTATSWYDPSFASQHLTPVERFFKTLYHLPWVSHGRVTVDYRPGEGLQGKKKYKGAFKKPMSSWYRRFSRSGKSQELDLLSSGTMSIPNITQRTSFETSVMSSVQASPRSGRSGRRHTHGSDSRHHKSGAHSSSRRHRHRHHHRRRRSLSTIGEPSDLPNGSPVIPAVYPYPYPAYPFTYPGYVAPPGVPLTPGLNGMPSTPPTTPGATQQGIPMQVIAAPVPMPAAAHRSHKKSPRGPRTRDASTRRPTYPNGYAPYQALAYPPQMYYQGTPPTPGQAVMTPGATPPHHQHQHHQHQQQAIQYVPVPMPVVPGAFNPGQADYFQTASSIPSPPSSPTPRAGSAAPPAAP